MGGVASWVNNNVIQPVSRTAENIVHNPLPVIETVALTAALGPAGLGLTSAAVAAPVAAATVSAMNGGSVANIAKAAISGYVGAQVASAAPSAINSLVTSDNPLGSLFVDNPQNITIASSALGASAQGTTNALLKGQPLNQALQSGIMAGATSGVYSAIGSLNVDTGIQQQINSVVNDAKNQVLPLLNQAYPAVSNLLGSLFVDTTPTPSGLNSLPSSVNTADQAFESPSSNVNTGVQNISDALSTAPVSQPTPTPSATPSPIDAATTPDSGLSSLPTSVNTPDQAFGSAAPNIDTNLPNVSDSLPTAPTSQPTNNVDLTPANAPSPIDSALLDTTNGALPVLASTDTGTTSDVTAPITGALPVSSNNLGLPPGVPNDAVEEVDQDGQVIYVDYSTGVGYDEAGNVLPGDYSPITPNDFPAPEESGLSTLPTSFDTTEQPLDFPAQNEDTGVQANADVSPIDTVSESTESTPSPIDTGTSGKLTSFTDSEHPEGVTTIESTDGQGNVTSTPVDTSGISDNINVAQNGTTISPSPIDSGLPAPNTVTESDTGTSTYYGQPTELGTTTNFQDNTSTTAYQDPSTGDIINTDSGLSVLPTTGTAVPGCTPSNIKFPTVSGATYPTVSGATSTPTATPTGQSCISSTGALPASYWLSSAPQELADLGSFKTIDSLTPLPGFDASTQSAAPAVTTAPNISPSQQLERLAVVDPELANRIANNQITSQEINDPRVINEIMQYDPRLLHQLAQRGYAVPGVAAATGGSIKNFASGGNSAFNEFCLSACTFMKNLAPTHINYMPPQKTPQTLGALHQISPQLSIYGSFGQLAKGGLPSKYYEAAPEGHHPEFVTGVTGYYAGGRGTGQSDDIPAMLHDGDYVIDADAVAALGDGSSKAGNEALMHFMGQVPHKKELGSNPVPAKIADGEVVLPESFVTALGGGDNKHGAKMLDQMRERLRDHKRSAPTSKIPPKAKSPLEYLKGKG
jgi:hypothetical protein